MSCIRNVLEFLLDQAPRGTPPASPFPSFALREAEVILGTGSP